MNVTGFSRFTVDWSSTAKIYQTSKNQQHVVDGTLAHSTRKVDQASEEILHNSLALSTTQ